MGGAATVLATRRLPEGVAGIETDHGLWAMALIAAAYQVFPVNPQQTARFRAWHQVPGAKSDAGGRARARGHGPHRLPSARAANRGRARQGDRVAFIDTRDVADVAAAILVEGPGIAATVGAKAPSRPKLRGGGATGPRAARGWHGA